MSSASSGSENTRWADILLGVDCELESLAVRCLVGLGAKAGRFGLLVRRGEVHRKRASERGGKPAKLDLIERCSKAVRWLLL